MSNFKTIVVLGGSYSGGRAARLLSQKLEYPWRVILIDRNSHHNHLYVFPRYAVTKGHEHKAFIPYANLDNNRTDKASKEAQSLKAKPTPLNRPHLTDETRTNSSSNILLNSGPQNPTTMDDRHLVLHATVESIDAKGKKVKLSRGFEHYGLGDEIEFEYCIYALGSIMPRSLQMDAKTLSNGTKASGCNWLQHRQKVIENSEKVIIAGGGALGIQLATDIANHYPNKRVTLIHSRDKLLPRFDPQMHDIIMEALNKFNVDVILQDRVQLGDNTHVDFDGHVEEKRIFTSSGKRLECDLLLLCTGQKPNSDLIKALSPTSVDEQSGLVKVTRSMQLAGSVDVQKRDDIINTVAYDDSLKSLKESAEGLKPSKYSNIFAVGDAVDAYGAIKSGAAGWFQAEIAVENIMRLINNSNDDPKLYYSGKPAIKLTTGLSSSVIQLGDEISINDNCPEDLDAASAWRFSGVDTSDMRI